MRQVVERAGGRPILGENSHLYKIEYKGEVVDSGDTVDAMSRSRYYGDALSRTYQRYLDELVAHPPKFVVAAWFDPQAMAATATPRFTELLRERYHVAIPGPETFVANGGGGTTLYERND